MTNDLFKFIGVQRLIMSNVDQKVDLLIKKIFNSMEDLLQLNFSEYKDLQQLIVAKQRANNEQSYFWDWMNKNGLPKLNNIYNNTLPENEELLDLLDFREMILEMDIDNGEIDSYFISIADTLTYLDEYAQILSEQAATIVNEEFTKTTLNETLEYHITVTAIKSTQQWTVNPTESPAGKKQDFCYTINQRGI